MNREELKVVLCSGSASDPWRLYRHPVELLIARHPDQVLPLLRRIDLEVGRGRYAAGYLSYEAAAGLGSARQTHAGGDLPLLCFGLYEQAEELSPHALGEGGGFELGAWEPSVARNEYRAAIAEIKSLLARGDTYQVNYTLRLRASWSGDPWALFRRLYRGQPAAQCAFVESPDHVICSASPELFFELDGTELSCRPMKGTAPRGLSPDDDDRRAHGLRTSLKDRAENLMILDMMRNDLGRIAEAGSVRVDAPFTVERYPTLLQMTSSVRGRNQAPFSEIVRALFPCASVTGAPKIRTMEIIKDLEPDPRGVYTGAIGHVMPGRRASFNVAIRTVAIDTRDHTARYGVGGGIVWDSVADQEYEECLLKAAVLDRRWPDFELLETMLWDPVEGEIFLLEFHLERLRRSAAYFGYPVNLSELPARLSAAVKRAGSGRLRLRLLVSDSGRVSIETQPVADSRKVWRLQLAAEAVDSGDVFLYHKTTNREVYDRARCSHPDCDDVVLWNENGEITESTVANVVIERGERLVTPPVSCGLLAGVFRTWLLARCEIEEAVISRDEMCRAEQLWLINSVRRWIPARLDPASRERGGAARG